jgi:hypothetical protein
MKKSCRRIEEKRQPVMLSSGRRSLRLKKTSDRRLWICQRCFHAQSRLYAGIPSEPQNDSRKLSNDKPLSPIEAFRKRFLQQESSTEDPKHPSSPADIFRTNWMNLPGTERPAPPISRNFSLGDLAEAYRKTSTPRKYVKRDIWFADPKQLEEQTTLEEVEATSGLRELSELDDMETGQPEVFAGEIMRNYQGVLPLNGEPYAQGKYPLKQGALIETRGYSLPLLKLM